MGGWKGSWLVILDHTAQDCVQSVLGYVLQRETLHSSSGQSVFTPRFTFSQKEFMKFSKRIFKEILIKDL